MLHKTSICWIASLLFALTVQATGNRFTGARSLAMANAVVALEGVESLFQNQAGIGYTGNLTAIAVHESRYGIKEYALMAAGMIIPSQSGNWGIGFYQFGKGIYRENKLGLAYSRLFGENFSAGLQFNYFATAMPENRSLFRSFTAEAGLMVRLAGNLSAGLHFFNPVLADLSADAEKFSLPWIVKLGYAWKINDALTWCMELEKDQIHPLFFKAGMEYRLHPVFFVRGGLHGSAFQPSAGTGIQFGRGIMDIGFSYHGNLGFSPAVTLNFII
jgi:hypothetical protein